MRVSQPPFRGAEPAAKSTRPEGLESTPPSESPCAGEAIADGVHRRPSQYVTIACCLLPLPAVPTAHTSPGEAAATPDRRAHLCGAACCGGVEVTVQWVPSQ